MTKLFKIFAAPALALVATAAVADEPSKAFTHDGVTYIYEATPTADGATLVTGHTLDGSKFRLVVRGNKVTGQADQNPVSFSVAGSRGAATGAIVADRSVRVNSAD